MSISFDSTHEERFQIVWRVSLGDEVQIDGSYLGNECVPVKALHCYTFLVQNWVDFMQVSWAGIIVISDVVEYEHYVEFTICDPVLVKPPTFSPTSMPTTSPTSAPTALPSKTPSIAPSNRLYPCACLGLAPPNSESELGIGYGSTCQLNLDFDEPWCFVHESCPRAKEHAFFDGWFWATCAACPADAIFPSAEVIRAKIYTAN